jgi:glutamate-ammonia-ligase adenylyltransferase
MLQLRHAATSPDVLVPGTLDAIAALRGQGYLADEAADYWSKSYRFLRSVESGLRLMNTTARHDLPEDEHELDKLAYLLGYESARALLDDCREYTRENRKRFQRVFSDAIG